MEGDWVLGAEIDWTLEPAITAWLAGRRCALPAQSLVTTVMMPVAVRRTTMDSNGNVKMGVSIDWPKEIVQDLRAGVRELVIKRARAELLRQGCHSIEVVEDSNYLYAIKGWQGEGARYLLEQLAAKDSLLQSIVTLDGDTRGGLGRLVDESASMTGTRSSGWMEREQARRVTQ